MPAAGDPVQLAEPPPHVSPPDVVYVELSDGNCTVVLGAVVSGVKVMLAAAVLPALSRPVMEYEGFVGDAVQLKLELGYVVAVETVSLLCVQPAVAIAG